MPSAATAGALLGAAREAAGLSIDAVAQQLKLAPRQVRALEEDDYTHLPGRTFVRGFVRNYARLVHLDPDAVLGALPAGAAAPALEAPTLQQTAPTMGELPTTDHSKPAWTRWAIPLTLAAIVAVAAVYEWLRPAGVARPAPARETAAAESPVGHRRAARRDRNTAAEPAGRRQAGAASPAPAGARPHGRRRRRSPAAHRAQRPPPAAAAPRRGAVARPRVPRLLVDRDARSRRARAAVRDESRRHDADASPARRPSSS